MKKRGLRLPVLIATLLLSGFAGCGGSGSEPAGGTSTNAATPAGGPQASAFHPKIHKDSRIESRQFLTPNGDNSVQRFGTEADRREFAGAAAALHDFLDARAAGNYAAACSYLAGPVARTLSGYGSSSTKARGCASALEAVGAGLPSRNFHEAADVNLGALRVQGARGYLLYRGPPHERVYAIPVDREGGSWKVAALTPVALSR